MGGQKIILGGHLPPPPGAATVWHKTCRPKSEITPACIRPVNSKQRINLRYETSLLNHCLSYFETRNHVFNCQGACNGNLKFSLIDFHFCLQEYALYRLECFEHFKYLAKDKTSKGKTMYTNGEF